MDMAFQPHTEEKIQEIKETLETITSQLLEFWWKLKPGLDRQKAVNIIARALKHRGHTTNESPVEAAFHVHGRIKRRELDHLL